MSDEINKFEVTCESIGGAPAFVLKFHGDTVRGELAGTRLYGENEGDGRTRLSLTAADGLVLADLTVHPRAHRDQTENIIDIASALLWSHWRWAMAKGAEETPGLDVVDVGRQNIGALPTKPRSRRGRKGASK